MKKIFHSFVFFVLLASIASAQSNKVYVANIEEEIDLGLAPYIRRVISVAEENQAEAIIFRINTFGGRIDAATQIKDAILNCKVKTIAFIDKRAISAGSLIALSCEKIVMVPGGSMGATTVVDQAGEKQSEKYQSFMRSEMRATAEKNGRRTDIAEGMVDETIIVPGLVDGTKLITLTSEEALKYGMADVILSSQSEVLEYFNLGKAEVVSEDESWAESVLRFINNPIISSLLIMIGLVGLFTEVKTPGWGLPGTLGVIALLIFFGAGYILEIASVIEIIIFVIGVILLLIEIFLIPGFGIAGVIGIVMMVAGLFLGLISDFKMIDFDIISIAIIQLAGSFVMAFVFIYLLSRVLPKTQIWNRLILQENIDSTSGYISKLDLNHLIGKKGVALTDLRPSGTALINKKRFDVVTGGEYILKGVNIIVKFVEGSKVVVEEDRK
ncbi:MAG: peptidase [Ignavibacteria bacterium RBG_13_36_8]|nr:MAG: peptidase [Ignavibacteria bacterium RBG_13_36_8]